MNTATDNRCGQPGSRMLAALLSLVAAGLVAGCGELPQSEALSSQEAPIRLLDKCDPSDCPGGPTNGKGIYIAEGIGYCIPDPLGREAFCPETFANTPLNGVRLTGQRATMGQPFPDPEIYAQYEVGARFKGYPVELTRIDAGSEGLIVTIWDGVDRLKLSGSDVEGVVLEWPRLAPRFRMRFLVSKPERGIALYSAEYNIDREGPWVPYCADDFGTAAFLPERNVSGVSARVTPDADQVSVGCRSGAIATCMVWGYRPWEVEGDKQAMADTLYGSCLQAKRAAFFVKSGDYKSYTVKGTPLSLEDRYEIMNYPMPGVEAVWTPDGASCLSPSYRRVPVPGSSLPALPPTNSLPPCDQALHDAAARGTLPGVLSDSAPLATGPQI